MAVRRCIQPGYSSGSALADSLNHLSTPTNGGHDAGDGMAPNAKLVYIDFGFGADDTCIDAIGWIWVGELLEQEYQAGVRVSTNSWG